MMYFENIITKNTPKDGHVESMYHSIFILFIHVYHFSAKNLEDWRC